jgi:hypothetical protein
VVVVDVVVVVVVVLHSPPPNVDLDFLPKVLVPPEKNDFRCWFQTVVLSLQSNVFIFRLTRQKPLAFIRYKLSFLPGGLLELPAVAAPVVDFILYFASTLVHAMPFFKELRRRSRVSFRTDKSSSTSTNETVPTTRSTSTLNSVLESATPPSSIQHTPTLQTPNSASSVISRGSPPHPQTRNSVLVCTQSFQWTYIRQAAGLLRSSL